MSMDSKYKNLHGNSYYKNYTNSLWNSWAKDLGFSDKEEMLRCLYKEWSMKAIADLLGVAESTVHYQLKGLGIVSRKRQYPPKFIQKRGGPLSTVKVESIRRRYRMRDGKISWAKLARQFGVSEITAKKYIISNK